MVQRQSPELVVDYQRNRRPPVVVATKREEVKRVDSDTYLVVQINKKIQNIMMSQLSEPSFHQCILFDISVKSCVLRSRSDL